MYDSDKYIFGTSPDLEFPHVYIHIPKLNLYFDGEGEYYIHKGYHRIFYGTTKDLLYCLKEGNWNPDYKKYNNSKISKTYNEEYRKWLGKRK
jgi:hypothetical protein